MNSVILKRNFYFKLRTSEYTNWDYLRGWKFILPSIQFRNMQNWILWDHAWQSRAGQVFFSAILSAYLSRFWSVKFSFQIPWSPVTPLRIYEVHLVFYIKLIWINKKMMNRIFWKNKNSALLQSAEQIWISTYQPIRAIHHPWSLVRVLRHNKISIFFVVFNYQ